MPTPNDSHEAIQIAQEIAGSCIGVRVRMLNRAMSRIYDDRLRPHGIKFSQMNVLTAVALLGPVQPIEVARTLSMEKSTLSRNVRVLESNGWIVSRAGETGNTQRLSITARGRRLLEEAAPAWRNAQSDAIEMLGERTVNALHNAADRLWHHSSA